MKVSVNLVTWNGKKYLPYCLESIVKQTFRDFSLFVLDNGSTDGTVEHIKSQISNLKYRIPKVEAVFNKKNVGFAAGHNQVLRLTKSEYVLLLNQDIILEPDYLEIIVRFLDSHPEAGAVTGKLLRWNFEKNKKTDVFDSIGLKIFKNHRVIELGAGELDSGKWDSIREIFGVSGAAPVYRRKALEDTAVNGEYFDEDFFSYKEDVDLAYRFRLLGWQAWYLPRSRAYHDRTARGGGEGGLSVIHQRKNKSAFVRYHSYKNHLFFLVKNIPPPICLKYFLPIFGYELKKLFYLLFFETATLRSLGEFFRKLLKIWKKRKFIMARRIAKTSDIVKWLNC